MPPSSKVHHSVIKRMKADPSYRPGNLIIGGCGVGVRVAPPEAGIGEVSVPMFITRILFLEYDSNFLVM